MKFISYIGITFGSLFAFVLSLGQLVLKKKQVSNYLLAMLFFCVSLWLGTSGLLEWFYLNNKIPHYNYSVLIIITTLFLTAPLLYYYFNSMLDINLKFKIFYDGIQLLLAGLAIVIYVLFIKNYHSLGYHSNFENLLMAGIFYIFISILLVLKKIVILLKHNKKRKNFILIGIIFLSIYLLITIFLRIYYNWQVSCFAVSIFLIILYLMGQRNPGYLQIIKLEAEKIRYAQSQLGNVDMLLAEKNLSRLMEQEKIFYNEDLNLKSLADSIKLTPHQLSEFINVRFQKTYNQYINSFRINEAIRLFKEEPDAAILTIAYQVGFNSSSVFYAAFKEICGVPPAEFRKRLLEK